MNAHLYWHPDMGLHDQHAQHVAMHSQRLPLVAAALASVSGLEVREPQPAPLEAFQRVHSQEFLDMLRGSQNLLAHERLAFDAETILNRYTWRMLELSAGAWCGAVDNALTGHRLAFCVSYAGHHAREEAAAGFCFTNQVAIAAHHALARGAQRVAVFDIDTHAGDGTVLSLLNEPRAFFGETYQPGFPGAFLYEPAPAHIQRHKVTFAPKFREYWMRILEQAVQHKPDLVLVSAGFDAHGDDPLSRMGLSDSHYGWLAERFAELNVPIVAGLEGGYNLDSTTRCAKLFLQTLINATAGTKPASRVAT